MGRLPLTSGSFFGRGNELRILNTAWQADNTNVISVEAFGGVGKTALVKAWLRLMDGSAYCGADDVFAWSFYSQGISSARFVSTDEFIEEALEFFGDTGPPVRSPWAKGQRLASLVRDRRALL